MVHGFCENIHKNVIYCIKPVNYNDVSSHQVDWLTEKMREANFTVSSMHGGMTQKERDEIMKEFRSGTRYVSCRCRVLSAMQQHFLTSASI